MTQNLVLNTTWEGLNPSNFSRLQENPLTHQNITFVDFYLHKPSVAAVFTVSYLLIFLVCMLGNGVVCFIVLRSKNMCTVTNLFILNLAISDLLVGIFCMPTTLVDNIITGWPFGSIVCKLSGMVQGISVSASVFTLVAIAVDRFRCIVYPFEQKLTIATSKLIIVIIWVLAACIMCPSGVMLQVTKEQRVRIVNGLNNDTHPFYWCRENWPNQEMRKIYTTVLFANIYLAPLSLIVIMYARIGFTLSKTTIPPKRGSGSMSEKPTGNNKSSIEGRHTISKKKTRVIMMLLVVALLFILSWLPLWTLMMLSDYASLTEHQHRVINIYVYPFAHWLAFFNSSVNPIIYGFFNENFRRGFQAAFKFQLCTADIERQKTFSYRIRGNAVLPVQPAVLSRSGSCVRSVLVGNGKCSCQEGGCLAGSCDIKEQDLIMEDLEKVSHT
ncbi:neuropeptide FF receptor 2-like [Micropterus salmoides]|uniref:neuropeptide FF receptor 2-like n=1 Tax=Micropterus salmoides TaxID=27706 RepID=UPI0018ED8A2F|nr:neuropeptide FF receptor 2-like [Micropterus salmoides]XP_038590621.1 neuropeptide FF receptor 2-like [Micropterus salmoides]